MFSGDLGCCLRFFPGELILGLLFLRGNVPRHFLVGGDYVSGLILSPLRGGGGFLGLDGLLALRRDGLHQIKLAGHGLGRRHFSLGNALDIVGILGDFTITGRHRIAERFDAFCQVVRQRIGGRILNIMQPFKQFFGGHHRHHDTAAARRAQGRHRRARRRSRLVPDQVQNGAQRPGGNPQFSNQRLGFLRVVPELTQRLLANLAGGPGHFAIQPCG